MSDMKLGYGTYSTRDYTKFRFLFLNREDFEERAKKIITSVKRARQVPIPIIVNEKLEIIDGQARFTAYKELKLPIYYMVIPGLTVEDARILNTVGTNWKTMDYIDSYAKEGQPSYVHVKNLYKEFGGDFTQNVINFALTGKQTMGRSMVANGGVVVSDDQYNLARSILFRLRMFTDIFDGLTGRKECYYFAVIFCTRIDVDLFSLRERLEKYSIKLKPATTIEEALTVLTEIYNYNRRGFRIRIDKEYYEWQNKRYSWYSKKYSERRMTSDD